jgi:hypothetical protein
MPKTKQSKTDITPSPHRLLSSLRDVGYDFVTAVADIVDNSIAAGARKVTVEIRHQGGPPSVVIADDGHGMTEARLVEAIRLGSERDYESDDLGKFGLGLKTASLSQCRRLVVLTRHSRSQFRVARAMLDLDEVAASNRWKLSSPPADLVHSLANKWLVGGTGTVVAMQKLDRIIPDVEELGGWDRRRLDRMAEATASHLSMVFHRFIEGVPRRRLLKIFVNGKKLRAWNPFALGERFTKELPEHTFEFSAEGISGDVRVQGYVLPPRDSFSSADAFESLSGPRKWNRQQGFYIYRNHRLIQSGGWCGMRAADEHTKLARIAVEFSSSLDELFNVNIAKMKVSIPPQLRVLLERAVHDVIKTAQATYRSPLKVVGAKGRSRNAEMSKPVRSSPSPVYGELMLALRAAALATGDIDPLARILKRLRRDAPELAAAAGLPSDGKRRSKQQRPASEVG